MSLWRPTAGPEQLHSRARMTRRIRQFFDQRGVVEVTTPTITRSGVTDPQIESLALASGRAWLRTSPEFHHKRLLAAGFGDLYELGPVFRGGERGRLNHGEFTLLEWYRVGWDWHDLARETVDLIAECLGRSAHKVQFCAWRECFRDRLDLDPMEADDVEVAAAAAGAPADCTRDAHLDFLFATRIQPALPANLLTVIYDYPASQAALARRRPDDRRVAERFEVFCGPVELANGYRELTDADEQRRRFERDNRLRTEWGRAPMPIDEELLAALEAGLPECSGVAVGFDRLVMLATGVDDIRRVMAFAPAPD